MSKSELDSVLLESVRRLNDRIIEDNEKMVDRLGGIDKTLIKQEENLRQHMYRTELNEMALAELKESLKPVNAHISKVDQIIFVAKWCAGTIVALSTLVATVLKIVEHFRL